MLSHWFFKINHSRISSLILGKVCLLQKSWVSLSWLTVLKISNLKKLRMDPGKTGLFKPLVSFCENWFSFTTLSWTIYEIAYWVCINKLQQNSTDSKYELGRLISRTLSYHYISGTFSSKLKEISKHKILKSIFCDMDLQKHMFCISWVV